jgi:hypothetical protein
MMRVSLKVWALTFVLVSLFLVISEPTAAQTIIHVPGDVPTIQGAINQAQNGDTVLVAPGTYSENINFDGKSITVTSDSSNGGSASNTIINGSEGPTVTFQSNETASAILNGFTVSHQSSSGETSFGQGIAISGASPTITGNAIVYNDGCGIGITNGASPAIRGNDISWNFLGRVIPPNPGCDIAVGIVVSGAGSVEISNNTIQGNNTLAPVNAAGGGISANNTAKLLIENNVIFNNTGAGEGANGSSGNTGGGVGGIAAEGIGDLALIQNLIFSNVVISGGPVPGGINVGDNDSPSRLPSGTLIIINNTVVGNEADRSAAEQLLLEEYPAQSAIQNNIFESTDNGIPVICAPGSTAQLSYNEIFGAPSPTCGGFNNIYADAGFVDTAVNNFHLTAASPAISAGNPLAADIPATDLDSLPRLVNGTISLGVYEYQPVTANSPVLTSSANPSYVGQTVTFTATLNISSAKSPVTGTIIFRDGAGVLGTVNVSTAGVAALSTNTLAVGSHSIYAVYSGDTDLPPGITNAINQVVSTYPTTTTLSASQTAIVYGQSVTFTADVRSPASSVPVTGGVAFFDGTNVLGVANVNGGAASFTTTSLAAGTDSITAEFVQNQTYSTSTSNAVTVTVASDFALSATPASRSINPGQSATFTISVASNSGFNQPVALTCSGLPTGATCTFSPSTIQNGVGSSQLVIQLANQAAMPEPHNGSHIFRGYGVVAPILCVLFLIPGGLRRKRLLVVLLISSCTAIVGCNPTVLPFTPQSTYSIVVTGASNLSNGPLAHSTTVSLQVW